MAAIKRYFADGNTALGFFNLVDSNLQGLKKLYALQGGSRKWMTALMEETGAIWLGQGYDIEYLHCALDHAHLDGLVIPALKAGIVNDTPPHLRAQDPKGAEVERISLDSFYRLDGHEENIEILLKEGSKAWNHAYEAFKEALRIHDEWEALYIQNMNFEEADRLTEEIAAMFINRASFSKPSVCRHRFFGGATPEGAVDFIPNLTEDIRKRYILKGRPGTGKSTLLNKLALSAEARGIDLEIYHCGFDPGSVDMVIAPEISTAILDGTAPHEYGLSRISDEIIDLYKALVKPGTDALYAQELERITGEYRKKIDEGTAFLKKLRMLNHALDAIYVSRADNEKLAKIKMNIQEGIGRLAPRTHTKKSSR